jgi:hypothetical protein
MDHEFGDEIGPEKPPAGNRRFNRVRLAIVLGLASMAAALAFLASGEGSPGDQADRSRIGMTLGALAGPFAGGIARHGQSCCVDFGWHLAARFCGPALLIGIAAQFAPMQGLGRFDRPAKLAAWTLGWLAWFFGVPASYLHALN